MGAGKFFGADVRVLVGVATADWRGVTRCGVDSSPGVTLRRGDGVSISVETGISVAVGDVVPHDIEARIGIIRRQTKPLSRIRQAPLPISPEEVSARWRRH